jgi:hypothetical protein
MQGESLTIDNVKAFNPLNYEIALLAEISHELANFRARKKGNLKHTYVASPYLSSCFSFDIHENIAFMGVPSYLFDMFLKVRWYVAHLIKDTPGIFLVMDMGQKPNNHPVAIRFFLRKARANSLLRFRKIRLVRMNESGHAVLDSMNDFFDLDVREVKRLEWETV